MDRSSQERGLSPAVHEEIDEEQKKRGQELGDRLDKLLRASSQENSSVHRSVHNSTEFISVSLRNSADSAKSEHDLWQVDSEGNLAEARPSVNAADAPIGIHKGSPVVAHSGTVSSDTTQKNAEATTNNADGTAGTVKCLTTHRDIDFSAKFVEKKKKNKSHDHKKAEEEAARKKAEEEAARKKAEEAAGAAPKEARSDVDVSESDEETSEPSGSAAGALKRRRRRREIDFTAKFVEKTPCGVSVHPTVSPKSLRADKRTAGGSSLGTAFVAVLAVFVLVGVFMR